MKGREAATWKTSAENQELSWKQTEIICMDVVWISHMKQTFNLRNRNILIYAILRLQVLQRILQLISLK